MFNAKQWSYIKNTYHLTPRQIEIARLVCNGLNNDQIAEKCDITYNTPRTHLAHICAKIGVYGRAELILHLIKIAKHIK
jgi:DNA-binding CsgD family transcriptional regulator